MTMDDIFPHSVATTPRPTFDCLCGKRYRYRQGLFKHKKVCSIGVKNPHTITDKQVIFEVIKQNQDLILENKEFKAFIVEQNSKLFQLASKQTTTINHNCQNNQFNLSFFLNERCKNAMNMSDFLDSLEILDDDFEDMGKLGYIQGITNIFIKGLKDLDETARPLHCSDIKRETIYIKNNNQWNKDHNKQQMKRVIGDIAHKNVKYIPIWRDANPDALDCTSKRNLQYMRIANQIMTVTTPDDDVGINKIIRNVANAVCIEKLPGQLARV